MQYLTAAQLALYKLTDPCSVICRPGYYGDFCAPVPASSLVPQAPWNQAGYFTVGPGSLQTMTLPVADYISQISFTGSDSLLVGLSYPSAVVLISLNTRQTTQVLTTASTGYLLDAVQVRYGQIFVARSQTASGPFDVSVLTGQLQVGPYGTRLFMPITIRALFIEVFIDKGMSTVFVYSLYQNQGRLWACYPSGSCVPWLSVVGVTGLACGMDCPGAVFVSVGNSILNVTNTSSSTLVSSGQGALINCLASSPTLNTLLYRTNTYVQQLSLGASQHAAYGAVLTLQNKAVSCSQCCSLDISDSQSLVILVENSVVRTLEAQQQPCPFAQTSQSVVSTGAAACAACPAPPPNAYLLANSPACAWRCLAGYIQRGSQCVAPVAAPCPAFFYTTSSDSLFGPCIPSVLPWAPGGAYVTLVAPEPSSPIYSGAPGSALPPYILAGGGDLLFLAKASSLYVSRARAPQFQLNFQAMNLVAPAVDATVCGSAANNNYYYLAQQGGTLWVAFVLRATLATTPTHCLWALNATALVATGSLAAAVAQAQYWTPGRQVCSATGAPGQRAYVILCGTNYVLQAPMASQAAFSVYAGQLGAGYRDGPVQSALFNAPTSVVHSNGRLYVTDTNNCVIRELDLARGTAWTVAGTPGVCERQDGRESGLRFPTALSLTPYDGFLLFLDRSPDESTPTARQYHTLTGHVWTVAISTLPSVTTALALNGSVLLQANATGLYYRHAAASAPCPEGTAALEGNAYSAAMCAPCGAGTFSNGSACLGCSAVACAGAGQRWLPCSGNSDSRCGQCTNKPAASPSVYTGPAQSYDGWRDCPWVYTPPCPNGTYQNGSACAQCPPWSTTRAANATSISGCYCPQGGWDPNAPYSCLIPSPFAAAMPASCRPFALCAPFQAPAFPFGLLDSCSAYAADSVLGVCPCNPGEYIAQIYPKRCLPCPPHLYSPDGRRCDRCPPYAEPSLDGSACRCAGGARDTDVSIEGLLCACAPGQAFDPAVGCAACPANTYARDGFALSDTPWLQSRACLPCPAGTYSPPGQTQCTACPAGRFRNYFMAACADCPAGQYATDPSSELSCTPCSASCGGLLESPCPTDASLLVCGPCPPRRNHSDFNGARNCATSCRAGYYELDGACAPCTAFNSTTCPAGNRLVACGQYHDAACAPCENATMPLYYAEWAPGTGAADACAWRCIDGYTPAAVAWAGTPFAVWECAKANAWSLFEMFRI